MMGPTKNGTATGGCENEEEEDDYMNMTFEDPTPARETLTQKKKRLAREAEIRGRPKSKAQLAQEEKEKREAALANSHIDTQSKGFKMMAALGYKAGTALGTARNDGGPDQRLLEPIGLATKEGRAGIGADAEKKRKIREVMAVKEDDLKRRKVEETGFRARQHHDREEKKQEGQVFAAMKVCERLEDEEDEEGGATTTTSDTAGEGNSKLLPQQQQKQKQKQQRVRNSSNRPLRNINVLWRGLVKERAVRERDARMRHDLQSSSLRNPGYDHDNDVDDHSRNDDGDDDDDDDDPEEDQDDRIALGKDVKDRLGKLEEVATDLDEDDEELEEFQTLPVAERLQKLVDYLRQRWHYCFWCKYRYPDEQMEGCPGTTEEAHD